MNIMKADILIVGAGFSGLVIAEQAAKKGLKVLIVEKRNHIGGNCYDYYDEIGVLVHKYGPHYFRTNKKEVFDYLSGFTPWHYVQYTVKAFVDGKLLSMPINLNTINDMYGLNLSSFELREWFEEIREKIDNPSNSEEMVISKVGREIYEKFFYGYTTKQWDLEPKELDASVTARIPIRINRDDRYFTDKYQAMPKFGYTKMFEKMCEHPNIKILLNTDFKEIKNEIKYNKLVYTGPIDEFFDFKFGKLPYRSLRFEHEHYFQEFYQEYSQINYPNEYDFTRVVEIKHVTGQKHLYTTIVREYPADEGDPYYPIPAQKNKELYELYKQESLKLKNTFFVGRLATYRYLNMDQIVDEALKVSKEVINE
jgi:UDP-galactopyranose mutase